MTMSIPSEAAIAGLGITELGRFYGRTASDLAAEAVTLAAEDAGVPLSGVDGLIVSSGLTPVSFALQRELGLRDTRLLTQMNAAGSTAGQQVQYAAMAIASGMADTVACVWADTPLQPQRSAGAAYGDVSRFRMQGFGGMAAAAGFVGANTMYALAARRHMERYGTSSEQFGAVAVSTRAWAVDNPLAQFRTPITLEDHQSSRFIVEPFHLLDCCLVTNGAIAVLLTRTDRARDLRQPPVHIWGWGQGHPGYTMERGSEWGLVSGATISGPTAMKMAGITPGDVTMCEIYDCYTYTTLITLEDYGFCGKGEGGAFVQSGAIGPGGSLPTNTGGGQLSSYYMWGMTPLSEAVIQARGQGGARQVGRNDVILVSGNGGILDYHSTLVLSPQAKSR